MCVKNSFAASVRTKNMPISSVLTNRKKVIEIAENLGWN